MKKIGTANIIWKEFDNFVKTEKEHSMKKEPGWYVSVRWSVPREIQDILWSMYTKTGEGKDADGCGCPLGEISGFKLDSIRSMFWMKPSYSHMTTSGSCLATRIMKLP